MNLVLPSVLTATHFLVFLQPFWAFPCWLNDRMQVFGTYKLASFLKPDAPSILI